jgi:2-oxoisovalerate dehydrogenase E2 component (dihydrolipoyl transacylase)
MPAIRDFLMPDLGEGLTEGEINRWLVSEGDVVVVDQPIAEITTEKAVVEVPTPFAGRVAALHGAEGETIAVGTPLISIEVAGAPSESASGNVLVGYGTSEAAPRSRRRRAQPGRLHGRHRRSCDGWRRSWASTSRPSPEAGPVAS